MRKNIWGTGISTGNNLQATTALWDFHLEWGIQTPLNPLLALYLRLLQLGMAE